MISAQELPDICLSFVPIYFLSSAFGIMPFKYQFGKKKSTQNQPPMELSVMKLIIAVILLVITIVHGVSAPLYVLHTSLPNIYGDGLFASEQVIDVNSTLHDRETKQSLIMKILNPLLITLMSISARIVAIFSLRTGLKQFFTDVKEADKFLRHIKNYDIMVNTRKHLSYSIGLSVSFVLLSVPINMFYLISVSEINNRFGVIWCAALVWSNLTGFCSDILFVFCAYLIRLRFKVINVTLSSLIEEENYATTFQFSTNFKREFS